MSTAHGADHVAVSVNQRDHEAAVVSEKSAAPTANDAAEKKGQAGEGFGSAYRLVAFSDAVFAVIITILVLELRPPAGTGYTALLKLWPTAVSYAISYLFIAIVWLNHHHLMRHTPQVSPRLIWANFTHLFSVSLVPFATSWIADSRLGEAPVSLYAIIFAIANASYLILCWEVMDRPKLGDEDIRKFMRMRAWITLGLFGAAAAISAISPTVSMVIIVFCLILYVRPEARSPRQVGRRNIQNQLTRR